MRITEIKIDESSLTLYILSNYQDINPDRKRPMVLICPGGGYTFCSEREAEPIAIRFCSFGFNTAVLRYSCNSGKDKSFTLYPTPQKELSHAISYVRNHAQELNTDSRMIVTLGFSAGGHLVASQGCFWKEYDNLSRPDAMVLCYPVISSGRFAHQGSFDFLCGKDETLRRNLSLENCVTKDTPPTFLWHTETDQSVPYQNSILFQEALNKEGVPNEIKLFKSGEHGLSLATREVCNTKHSTTNPEVQVWPELVRDWIFRLFGDSWL